MSRLRRASGRQEIMEQLDRVFRPWVLLRAGHRCERCGAVEGASVKGADGFTRRVVLHVAHFRSCRIEATRWHPLNVAALCDYCHLGWAHHEISEFKAWWEQRIGDGGMSVLNQLWKLPETADLDEVRQALIRLAVGGNGA